MPDILSEYVDQVLRPTKQQIDFLNSKLRAIKHTIEHSAANLSLDQIRSGGSFAKKNMLRYHAEADLVLGFRRSDHKGFSFQSLLENVYQSAKTQFPQASIKRGARIAVTIEFPAKDDEFYPVDLVPSYTVTSPLQIAEVRNADAYQGITTIWHGKYVRQRSEHFPQYRYIVMLLKDWNNEHETVFKSYHLELLVATAIAFQEIDLKRRSYNRFTQLGH